MKTYYIILFILSKFTLVYGQSQGMSPPPVYTGPFSINGQPTTSNPDKNENPFIFKQTLSGEKKYDRHTIKIKEGWTSFSLDLEISHTVPHNKKPRILFELTDNDINLYNHVYFWGSEKGKPATLRTTDPEIPRDKKMRSLTHKGKNLLGKHRIKLEHIDGKVTTYFDGEKLFTFGSLGDYDYLEIGTSGYKINISNLKINGYSY